MSEPVYEYVRGQGWVPTLDCEMLPCPVKLGRFYRQGDQSYKCILYGELRNKEAPVYTLGSAPHGSGHRGAVIGKGGITCSKRDWHKDNDVWVLVPVEYL